MKFISGELILLILICIYGTSSFFYISKIKPISDPDYQSFIERIGQSTGKNIEVDPELFKSPEVKYYLTQKVLEKLSDMKKEKNKIQKQNQVAKLNRLMSGWSS